MFQHVCQHPRYMLIGGNIEYLLTVSVSFDDARGAQQPQVVADQRIAQVELVGDVVDRNGHIETG